MKMIESVSILRKIRTKNLPLDLATSKFAADLDSTISVEL